MNVIPLAALLFCLIVVPTAMAQQEEASIPRRWWPDAVEQALGRAGRNRLELTTALRRVPRAQREGMAFLIENMPEGDLRSLSSRFLLKNVALAFEARHQAPWRERVPQDVFLNEILPYASLNEARDGSRKMLREKALPLVADCRTPAEAAQRLNEKIFPLLKVRYSTERNRPDQSPLQSIESGLASCSGLAILLVDACRAVGVPARVAGTPMWANGRGNHTWVEIWDDGWHFTGAAEPDPGGLDRGWFVHDAAQARQDVPQNAIYATSFKKTGLAFPLVWAPEVDWVGAVNVTDRYAVATATEKAETIRLLVQVLDRDGKRVAARVAIQDAATGQVAFEGTSKDETADLNDLLVFNAAREHRYRLVAVVAGQPVGGEFKTEAGAEQKLVIDLRQVSQPPDAAPPAPKIVIPSPPATQPVTPLAAADALRLQKALAEFFAAPNAAQARWTFAAEVENLLQQNEPAVRQVAWDAYRAAPIHEAARRDYDAKQVRFKEYLSAYTLKSVGTRPAHGWPLFIAMHGGGGAPKEVNDSQWKIMQSYYKDHPEAGGYLYLALRAPNDTWNGFYDDYVYPLVANLIWQFLLWGDVDADKVFLMGYSHGGYGAFAIGPKMPDRFAAIHASASAPTDGETTAKTLRNTIFSAMVGDQDTMYGRLERVRKFDAQVRALRGDRTDVYPVTVEIKAGYGHPGLPDRDKIATMYPAVRNPVPRELTWEMTDGVISDFFWLHAAAPGKTREINAVCRDNRITVTTTPNVTSASLLLDSRLVDFGKPLTIEVNGQKSERNLTPSLRTLCETLQRRGDPALAFTAQVDLAL